MNQSDATQDLFSAVFSDAWKSDAKLDPLLRFGGGSAGGITQAFGDAGAMTAGDLISLDILLADGVDASAATESLLAAGMTGIAVEGRTAGGWIDADAIDALEAIDAVVFARATYGLAMTGSVGKEGSIAINADAGREDFGLDGSGVKVGVLSDSFNSLGGFAADRQSGDLGAVKVLEDSFGTDEGRAMLQIVHDVAPGADLLFHTANGGQANFASGIRDLAKAGADVIVDDIIYLAEPFYQDGLVSQAIDDVAAKGVSYFTAAGNSGKDAYESKFLGSGIDLNLTTPNGNFDFGEMHDFDRSSGVDVRQRIVIPEGQDMFVSFQWDQPFASLSSGGRASQSDMDILLFKSGAPLTFDNLVAMSASANVGRDPVEIFRFINRTEETNFDLVITHFGGPEAGLMKYVELGGARIAEHQTDSSAVFGHAPAEGAVSVGAAFWGNTPNYGQAKPILESFSSVGDATVLFDEAGRRLSKAEVREGVDVVAPDGTNTTFFGQDIGFDADSKPNFFGTSAAAPHAAAVAALMLQADPNLSPDALRDALRDSAIDMGPKGFDDASGAGLIDAAAALKEVTGPRDSTGGRQSDELFGGGATDSLRGAAGDDILRGLGGDDLLRGDAGADKLLGGSGDDTLRGGGGRDILSGWRGDDRYVVGEGGTMDIVVERAGGGEDTVLSMLNYRLPTHVENLIAKARNLELTGNVQDNDIAGSSGNDRIIGAQGDDVLRAGRGNDRLEGHSGADQLAGHGGDDILFGGSGNDVLNGGSGRDIMAGGRGDDIFIVDQRSDIVVERAGRGDADEVQAFASYIIPFEVETLRLIGGRDLSASGRRADDILIGNNGDNAMRAGAGDDRLEGGRGDDMLLGHTGDDTLFGGDDVDLLMGHAGQDTLAGEAGDDRLFGGADADVFVFAANGGEDRIEDFEVGVDRIQAEGLGFASGADIVATAVEIGDDVRVDFGAGTSAVLTGIRLSDLNSEDFLA